MTEISQGLFVIPSSTEYLSNPLWNKTQCVKKVKVKSLSRVQLFGTPWTVAHQAPLSMGFSREEHWSGLPFPFPGDLPNPRDQIQISCLAGGFFTDEPPVKPPTLANDIPTSTVTV